MPFAWEDYYSIAQRVATGTRMSEAMQRTAVSRAYLYIFNVAKNHATVTLNREDNDERGSHGSIPAFYRNQFGDVEYQEVSSLLRDIRSRRESCDYCIETNNVQQLLDDTIEDCDEICRIFSEK
jgi:hypothetical protein